MQTFEHLKIKSYKELKSPKNLIDGKKTIKLRKLSHKLFRYVLLISFLWALVLGPWTGFLASCCLVDPSYYVSQGQDRDGQDEGQERQDRDRETGRTLDPGLAS